MLQIRAFFFFFLFPLSFLRTGLPARHWLTFYFNVIPAAATFENRRLFGGELCGWGPVFVGQVMEEGGLSARPRR